MVFKSLSHEPQVRSTDNKSQCRFAYIEALRREQDKRHFKQPQACEPTVHSLFFPVMTEV